jgi:hypothetical protein
MTKMEFKNIIVSSGQTVEDIAVMEYGCQEGFIYILMDNNLGPNSLLYGGQVLKIRTVVPEITTKNISVGRRITDAGIRPNAGMEGAVPEGGYVEDGYVEDEYLDTEDPEFWDNKFVVLEEGKLDAGILQNNNSLVIRNTAGEFAEATIAISELVGRKATGDIEGLSVAEVLGVLGFAIADIDGLQTELTDLADRETAVAVILDAAIEALDDAPTTLTVIGKPEGKVSNYTETSGQDVDLTVDDVIVIVDNSGNFNEFCNLPTMASCWDAANGISQVIYIKLLTASGFLHVRANPSDTGAKVDNGTSKQMDTTHTSLTVVTDGTNWWIMDIL